jgi:hypothetical protein
MSEKKSPFGSYAILLPVRHTFADEPHLWWEIKPPSAGDELALTSYIGKGKATYKPDGGLETEDSPSWLDVLFFQIALLFGGTNIPDDPDNPVEDGGKPFISASANRDAILAKLKKMPMEMISEIADAIAEIVPGWGPKNPMSRAKRDQS